MKNGKQTLNMMVKKAINQCILRGWNWRDNAGKLLELLVNSNPNKFDKEDLAYMLGQLEIVKAASEAEIVDEVPGGTIEAEKVADEQPKQDGGIGVVSVGGKKAAETVKNLEIKINLNDVLDRIAKINVEKAAEVAVSSLVRPALAGFMKGGMKEAENVLTGKASETPSSSPTSVRRIYGKDPDFISVISSFFK